MDKREFLKLVMSGALSGTLGSIFTKTIDNVIGIPNWLKLEQHKYSVNTALNHIVNSDKPLQIYAGTNLIAKSQGRKGLSIYLKHAGEAFSEILQSSTNDKILVKEYDPDDDILLLDREKDLILLGGPVANIVGGKICGYEYSLTDNGILFPIFKSNNIRWGFYCGEQDYGQKYGNMLTSKRFEAGNLVERPLYGIRDNNLTDIVRFEKDDEGFLAQEVLLITKIQNPYNQNASVFIAAGMHGYSISQFATEIGKSVNLLRSIVRDHRSYQVYIPVNLIHHKDSDFKYTEAKLDWNNIMFEAYD